MEGKIINRGRYVRPAYRGEWAVWEDGAIVGLFPDERHARQFAGLPTLVTAARSTLSAMPAMSGHIRATLRTLLQAGLDETGG